MLFTKPGAWPTILTASSFLANAMLALASEKEPQVEWISPSAGDVFGSGDSIIGKWTADTAVVSPAFKLCPGQPQSSFGSRSEDQGADGSSETCGSKVYPTVQQSAGSYSISLTVPNVTTEQGWHLEMSDDFENTWASPSFSLSPSEVPSMASAAGAQAPFVATSASTMAVPVTAIPVPLNAASASAATPMLTTRVSPPVAAFAIPLSIVGAILLVAAFLCLRHNRKLVQERAQDVEKLILSRKSSIANSLKSGFSRQSDIEHALNVLSKVQSQGEVKTMPVPLFMPVEVPVQPVQRESRRSTREAYHPKQYTEYHRSSRERPPSYRTAPVSHASRSHSRARSLVSSVSSRSCASSRTAVDPPSQYPEYRQRTGPYRSSHHHPQLPPLRVGSPLYCSEYEYNSEVRRNRDGEWNERESRYESDAYSHTRHTDDARDVDDVECATHSMLEDYLSTERSPKPPLLPPPRLPNPPLCLMPAPQKLHVRNGGAISPRSCIVEEDEECMKEVNLYDAVAESLNKARRR